MRDELLQIRKRLRDDFPYYSEAALKIRTKNGEIAPLKLKPAQLMLNEAIDKSIRETGMVRVIVLKARQQGLSTAIGAYIYFKVTQTPAQRAMVVTHSADSTKALFDLTRRYYDNTPSILKPSTRYASRRELFFDVLDSSYVVATAGSESIGRGETLTQVHLSEVAFYPPAHARENLNSVFQCVPNKPGTSIFIESTANGVSGPFYDLWMGAVRGDNGFVPLFIPWYLDPEYRLPAPASFEHTPDEEELVAKFGLDNDQLMFRRRKIGENGLDLFKQEYPSTADEAFLTTGRPVFNPEQLQGILQTLGEPIKRLALEGGEWCEHPRGELLVYKEYDPTETYTIGCDTSAGIRGRDYSVAIVLDRSRRQVAVLRGWFAPDYLADLLHALGTFYNLATIAPEANNHGILTVNRLQKDLAYPFVFTEIVVDKTTDEETVKIGFHTNVKTKPLIIDKLRASVRDGEIELTDAQTVREMLQYVVDENGRMEAEKGSNDDCVMALAIANYVHEGNFQPIQNEESWYIEMV